MKNYRHIVRAGETGLVAAALVAALTGCGQAGSTSAASESPSAVEVSETDAGETQETSETQETTDAVVNTASVTTGGVIDASDLFSERDLTQTADLTDATTIEVTSGQDVQISAGGVYVLTGEAQDVTVAVNVDETEKVQLVLDGLSVTNADVPVIYVGSADKVFVTTTEGSTNTLTVTGTFAYEADEKADAAIFSRDDLVLNGLGTLVVSSTDNGITSKDDLKVTGGTCQVTAVADALEANDSIRVAEGALTLSSTTKDGMHSEDDDDDTTGYVYVCGGTISIDAADDGIHATTYLQVDGGTLSISAAEALEATYVQVNGGELDITASDDGINASYKSKSIGTPTIEVTGGNISVAMGAGDTDALDANGDLIVSGGQIDITGQFAFDFDGTSSFTGGTITVNGEQVSEITNSMMMGGGMMGGPMGEGQEGMHGGPQGGMGGGPRGGMMGTQQDGSSDADGTLDLGESYAG